MYAPDQINKTNKALAPAKHTLTATKIVAKLADLQGWKLTGSDTSVAIEKTYVFENFHGTMFFVNAVAFIAHAMDHHPILSVHFDHCVVCLSTHDAGGISMLDFECAERIDSLQA